ncbi:MAG: hypothetical protein KJ063_14505 [Anaerolineae bacterium]|nr:hypothetical protein [Anaerolineae bacterium]
MKRFEYGFLFRLWRSIFPLASIIVVSMIFYALIDSTVSLIKTTEFMGRGYLLSVLLLSWGIGLFVIAWFFTLSIGMLTIFPSIMVNDDGFKVCTSVGQSKWLPWKAIHKIRSPFFYQRTIMIGAKGLGPLFVLNGLLFWLGSGGFLISQGINNYQELILILREKREDLFV